MGTGAVRGPIGVDGPAAPAAELDGDDPQPGDGTATWLIMPRAAVPEPLRARVMPMALVMLRPGETIVMSHSADPAVLLDPELLRYARLVAAGMSRVEIAVRLQVSPRTVDRRLSEIRERLGVRSAVEMVAVLAQRGLA